jgi:hypothetical protein
VTADPGERPSCGIEADSFCDLPRIQYLPPFSDTSAVEMSGCSLAKDTEFGC